MKSPAFTLKLLAAVLAGGALLTSLPAQAGRDDDDHRHWRHERHADHRDYRPSYYRDDHRHWDDHRGRGHKRGHYKERWESRHEYRDRVVIKEKVIVKHRPVVREHYYYEPYPRYSYSRDPAIVIGVNVPPIVIPLR